MNTLTVETTSSGVATVFEEAIQLTPIERLTLAKLLLDSILSNEASDETDWSAMSLDSFQRDWDNPEDAVYDELVS